MEMAKKYLQTMKSDFKGNWYKIPNILTEIRLFGSFVVTLLLIFCPRDEKSQFMIAIVFTSIAATDLFDGFFARILHQKTEYGRLLDPIADAALGIFTLIGLSVNDTSVRVLTVLVIARQIHLLWIFSKAEKNGKTPKVVISGKVKTALVFIVIALSFLPESIMPYEYTRQIIYLAIAMTICSWIEYWVVLDMVAKK